MAATSISPLVDTDNGPRGLATLGHPLSVSVTYIPGKIRAEILLTKQPSKEIRSEFRGTMVIVNLRDRIWFVRGDLHDAWVSSIAFPLAATNPSAWHAAALVTRGAANNFYDIVWKANLQLLPEQFKALIRWIAEVVTRPIIPAWAFPPVPRTFIINPRWTTEETVIALGHFYAPEPVAAQLPSAALDLHEKSIERYIDEIIKGI